jgi:Glycosyl transferase family 11
MITHPIYGGLGNQLFQIFTVIALSLKTGHDFIFRYSDRIEDHATVRPTYWDDFLVKLLPKTSTEDCIEGFVKIHEDGHLYQDLVPRIVNHETIYELDGYFQSYKYFQEEFATICDMIGVQDHIHSLFEIVQHEPIAPISIHFRRGDYKSIQHLHPILPFEYYRNSLMYIFSMRPFLENSTITIFCEPNDKPQIEQEILLPLMELFPKCEFRYVHIDLSDYQQMLLMSQSPNIIIANSTFSWWAGMLSAHPDKIVCYPWQWFGEAMKRDVRDMFPPGWTRVAYFTTHVDDQDGICHYNL